MKKIFIVIVTCMLSFSSCNVLDTDDLNHYGPDVWNDSKLINAYLTNLYAEVFNYGWPLDGGNSDECIGIMGKDAVQSNNGAFKFWPYSSIRDINTMLANIGKSTLTEAQENPLKGQALFLRAFQYFKMVRLYGGVPIIKVPQDIKEDLKVSRNSTAECFAFIMQDLDDAYKLLPVKYSGNDNGRISQCVVAAFKGRVALYMASPQFNPSNPYGNTYWENALTLTKAAKDLLDENDYNLVDNYTDVFETKNHSEAILTFIYNNPSKTNGRHEDGVRPLSESKNVTGYDQPTWGLAEAFPMKDGKQRGESDKYTYDVQSFWENRDPRFNAVIVYNAGIYELGGKKDRRQYTTPNIANSLDAFGYNILGESSSRTGLFCKKGILEDLPVAQVGLSDVDWLEIRYAEVLFNYAEAANENGDTEIGYETLKAIRKRAGIESGVDNIYGLKTNMTREEMRIALLNEKRVEFCFEGQRFWDLRRHRLLHTQLNGQHKFGILAKLKSTIDPTDAIKRAESYTLMSDEFDYEPIDLIFQNVGSEDAMYMPESYYFFPIAKSEIEKNSNLEQNKDWGGSFNPEL